MTAHLKAHRTVSVCVAVFAAVLATVFAAAAMVTTPAIAAEPATQPSKSVRFVSPDGPVTLTVNGGEAVQLAKGAAADFRLNADRLKYTVASGEDWKYDAEVDLTKVSQRIFSVKIPGMHVRIVNRSDEPRQVLVAGRHFGVLGRGRTRTFGPIEPGVTHLMTIGQRSRTHIAASFSNRPGGMDTVVVSAHAAALMVKNPISRPVRVQVDSRDYGELPPDRQLSVLGLAPGSHLVELLDIHTGRPYRFDAQVRQDRPSVSEVATIALHIENRTGELLTAPAALGGVIPDPLQPGEVIDLVLPQKSFKLVLAGKESELVYDFDVDPRGGARQTWTIERPTGQLHLTNGTGEIATVQIDRFGSLSLPVGAVVNVQKVPAGLLKLEVRTADSKRTFTRGINLRPLSDVQWTVTTGRAVLLIRNRWAEPVDLAIDGSPRGRVSPLSTFRVPTISPGEHRVVAQTLVSKHREVVHVQIVDGETTELGIDPPGASLKLVNEGDVDLTVFVRGKRAGTVKPTKTGNFPVPSGRLAVEIRGPSPNHSLTWNGVLAPAQQIVLPNPRLGAAPVRVHNDTTSVWKVRIDAREPVDLAAGKAVVFGDLAVGAHVVEIVALGNILRQRVVVRRNVPPVDVRLPTFYREKPTK